MRKRRSENQPPSVEKGKTNGRRRHRHHWLRSLLTLTSWLVLLPNSSSVFLISSTSCDSRAASTRRPLWVVARTEVRGAENAGEPFETPSPPPPPLPASSLPFPPKAFFFFLPPAKDESPLGLFFAIVERKSRGEKENDEYAKTGIRNRILCRAARFLVVGVAVAFTVQCRPLLSPPSAAASWPGPR